MREVVVTKTDRTIVGYLFSLIYEEFEDIINNNNLSENDTLILHKILDNTIRWIDVLGSKLDGQKQLLNTISREDSSYVSCYDSLTLDDRLIRIAECRDGFDNFLDYVWKIMLDIYKEKEDSDSDVSTDSELLDPANYVDDTVTEYICFNFPDDKFVNYSVILPEAGSKYKRSLYNIVGRMLKTSNKPEKWFFKNNRNLDGKNYYDYSTAAVYEEPSIVNLGDNSFYIECMDCIKTDFEEWNNFENCSECVFSLDCVKGRK